MYSVLQFWWLDIWKSLILKGHWHFYKFCPRSNTISLSTSIKFIYKDEVNCHIATFVIGLTMRKNFSWPTTASLFSTCFSFIIFWQLESKKNLASQQCYNSMKCCSNFLSFFHKGLIIYFHYWSKKSKVSHFVGNSSSIIFGKIEGLNLPTNIYKTLTEP